MDRNVVYDRYAQGLKVATREGGVDRNFGMVVDQEVSYLVATREGGVDRNCCCICKQPDGNRSPPARVAWIET